MHQNQPHANVFIPNYPPPQFDAHQPPPFFFNAPPEPVNRFDIYKNRLSTYLQNRNPSSVRSSAKPKKSIIKLNDCCVELKQGFAVIDFINEELEKLSHNSANISEDQRQHKLKELQRKKGELVSIVTKYKDPGTQTDIKNAIEQRKAKRHRIKLRKAETKELKRLEAKNRQQKHERIDKWFAENAQKIANERRHMQTEQKASYILSNVHQRKTEATKYISLFASLKELHQLRSRKKKNEHFKEGDHLSNELDDLRAIWIEALQKYNNEEKRLRDIINDDSNLNEWRSVLFGSTTAETSSDSAGSNSAQQLNELISIRKQWDAFIVSEDNPFGSSIPVGWVMPNPKPSEKWKKYQKNK